MKIEEVAQIIHAANREVQKLTDAYIIKVDKHAEAKEKDVMTV